MAYDDGLAQLLRDDLSEERIIEKKMFGGIAFMLDGNMVCGVHKRGAMFRVGKDNEATALGIPGAGPMMMTGRKMSSMIDLSAEAAADEARRSRIMALAIGFVKSLPPK